MRDTVRVLESGEPDGMQWALRAGDTLRFGRGGGTDVDLVVPHPGVADCAGILEVGDTGWFLTNPTPYRPIVVRNMGGGAEHVKVLPRRRRMPIPFETSHIVLAGDMGAVLACQVIAPDPEYLRLPDLPAGAVTPRAPAAFELDTTSKHFLVLVALCEAQVRFPGSVFLPSVPQIAERLYPVAAHDVRRRATLCRQVNAHIDYLANEKLRVREPQAEGLGRRADWRRAALVAIALQFDLVTVDHINLLPHPRTTA